MKTATKHNDDPRNLVFWVAGRVLDKGQPLDEALEAAFTKTPGLGQRDRAFVKNLATTLFRYLAFTDRQLDTLMRKPLPKKAFWVRHWLRIGATQILFLEVPDHAAVNTTVEAIGKSRYYGARAFRGLANGVLRNVIRAKDKILQSLETNPEAILPAWLQKRWRAFYGPEGAAEICRVFQNPPPLDLSLKNPDRAGELAKTLGGEEVFRGILRVPPKGPVTTMAGFAGGEWWVQDLAAGLPGLLLRDVRGKRILDLCAAPGGKTLGLAARGAKVTALDFSKKRLDRLAENLKRTGLGAELVCRDVLKYQPSELFDGVLLDAPCSATGTLRRHPDIPYLRKEPEIKRLAGLQDQMLERAVDSLKPGGLLVYCVCSMEPEEAEELIEGFLTRKKGVQRVPVKPQELCGHKDWITKAGELRTLPSFLASKGGMDGFFAARLRA